VQSQVLYLGEINGQQHAVWCKMVEVAQAGKGKLQQVAIFPEDRQAPALDCDVVQVKLSDLQLKRLRQSGV